MMKFAIFVIALTLLAGVNAQDNLTEVQKRDQALCNSYCAVEWADQPVCAEVCLESAIGEVTDCNAGDNDSKDEKYAFWSGCSFGLAVGRDATCGTFCAKLHFTHNLSKFFELGCTHVCKSVRDHAVNNKPISCRNHVCGKLWGIEACWRGCNFAAGLVEGTHGTEGLQDPGN